MVTLLCNHPTDGNKLNSHQPPKHDQRALLTKNNQIKKHIHMCTCTVQQTYSQMSLRLHKARFTCSSAHWHIARFHEAALIPHQGGCLNNIGNTS
uniref:Uncharacterized protein n=1 Tax=Rhipicephalus microplus TaxID=6941 RepID=A0A6G5AIX6_RHIMP